MPRKKKTEVEVSTEIEQEEIKEKKPSTKRKSGIMDEKKCRELIEAKGRKYRRKPKRVKAIQINSQFQIEGSEIQGKPGDFLVWDDNEFHIVKKTVFEAQFQVITFA